jgi:Family of unknown function (DUF5752)
MAATVKKGATKSPSSVAPFLIKDCALLVQATGRKARFLQELRDHVADVVPTSIYHHFWGGLLQPRFEEREFNNDFASWVRHGLHEAVLAERLAAIDPTQFADLEALRVELLELIDARLDEAEHLAWAHATEPFEFACAQIVVFDTQRRLKAPAELVGCLPELSTSSVFYHFVDARSRTPDKHDDFSEWLAGFGPSQTASVEALAGVDPFFGTLGELRERLTHALAVAAGLAT